MVKVAIAGGTGGVGRAIAEAILATGKHDVYILSRSSVSPFFYLYSPSRLFNSLDIQMNTISHVDFSFRFRQLKPTPMKRRLRLSL
jgi:nucleoside-diphosphate-sugar epimerase